MSSHGIDSAFDILINRTIAGASGSTAGTMSMGREVLSVSSTGLVSSCPSPPRDLAWRLAASSAMVVIFPALEYLLGTGPKKSAACISDYAAVRSGDPAGERGPEVR